MVILAHRAATLALLRMVQALSGHWTAARKAEYTVPGNTINAAGRLEEPIRRLGIHIVITRG